MKIKKLKLKNYRNCEDLELLFEDNKNLIIGKNAQGKTNILESIFFLSSLKTQRTSNNLELIKFQKNIVEINAEITKNTEIELDFSYTSDKKREVKINKVKTRPKEFKQILKTVLFSTEDLLLLRGSPENRRSWLDTAILQIYPAYDDRLSKYNKIRTQKNNYLKNYDGNSTLLDVYDEQLAILGSNIIFLRKKFLKEIEKITQQKHLTISGSEELSISYSCNFLEEETEIEQILEKYKQKQQERRELEIIRGQTLVGPHKDDIIFCINNQDASKFASQGQQRTVVLSLKLAELDIITEKIGDTPILLLDDVLAELDDLRQNFLLSTIKENIQTIITSVDTLLFDKKFLKDVKLFKIENGTLIE